MSSNSYRIRTTVGGGENVINVNLKQKVKTLNILSLEIEPEDEYDIHTSDYGVIVGRVLANNAFGVPNVKVSVFIPISSDDESDYVISNEYPYKTPQSKDINGVKYNLVLKKKDGPGTFVDKNTMLDNEGYREVYDKYWTYTTTTNQSGDYMIFGVPTGSTQIHYDCDLSDIGMLSQHPYDLVAKGYDANLFDSMNEFTAKDLNSAVHIISQDKTVYVYPFWGDKNANKIGITRADIDLNYKFEPSCVFMGSSITDPQGSYIGVDGQPNGSNGLFNSLATSVGDIEIIRKTQDGRVEELKENVVGIIDGNGVWCYQIPMNLDRIGTDEYGNIIAINDPERGIPTRARVRFRISLTDAKDESASEYTAKFLIPCNPPLAPKNKYDEEDEKKSRSATINYEAFSEEDWNNIYEFGDKTPESCFRNLYWGKVYSVKQYYLRYQYEFNPKTVGYGDTMPYDVIEDFTKPGVKWYGNDGNAHEFSFKDFPYVGKDMTGDRYQYTLNSFDFTNYSTRNGFRTSCISSIDNIDGLNPFPYNTMYAGAEEHIDNKTVNWFTYHFSNESSNGNFSSKGLHFCFENDWVNGCLYFPRVNIKRINGDTYEYFGANTDKSGNQPVPKENYYPYVYISGRHNYRANKNNEIFELPTNSTSERNQLDVFLSSWVGYRDDDDDDQDIIHWGFTPVDEELFYVFSRCKMFGGVLTKKKTMLGQNVFYYRCGVNAEKNYRRLYATDIILLGNLDDIYDSLPKLYNTLPATTATFPPIIPSNSLTESGMSWTGTPIQLEKFNDKDSIWEDRVDIFGNTYTNIKEQTSDSGTVDFSKVDFVGYDSDYAKAFLGEATSLASLYCNEGLYEGLFRQEFYMYMKADHENPASLATSILLGMLNRRYALFFGLMYSGGISCFLAYLPAAFVNLSRICELDVHNDAAFKTTHYPASGAWQPEEVTIPLNGIIDAFDITTNENRSHFASMNYNIDKREKNDFVYKQYVTTPMIMSSFDGRLKRYIENEALNGIVYGSDEIDESYMEFRFRNPYMAGDQRRIMHISKTKFEEEDLSFTKEEKEERGHTSIRKKIAQVNYCNDHIILTENSFYFYFGLRSGFSAIDALRTKFIGKLKEETIATNPLLVNKTGQTCEGTTAMIESTLTWRNMTPPVSVYIYQGSTLEFSNTYDEGSSATLTLKAGIHKAVVTDSSGKEYQRVFSLSPQKITMDAVGYYNELTNVPELEILLIDGQSVAISSQSGNILTLSATTNTYDVTCDPSFSAVTSDNLIQFSNETTIVNVKATDTGAPCVTGESNVIFKKHIKPKLLLNGVPVEQLKYWKSYTDDININTYQSLLNNTPDSVFKSGRFFVWDSIKTAHPGQSSRNYNFDGVASDNELAYISSMCSSVFGQDGMELRDINKAPTYTSQGIYLVYQNFNYREPNKYWGREIQPGFNLHRVQLNQIEPNVANFRNAPHIVGTNYPRYNDKFSKKTFLKKSALWNDGMLGDSGYTNNQVYISHEYGARSKDADIYYGDGIFGIYLFGLHHIGLRNRSIKELDKPGILSTTPKISGTTNSSYYLVDTVIEDDDEETDTTLVHKYSGATNYYGVRTVDKRMDYQFALKTPLLLPSGVESFPGLEQKNLMGGEMVVHLYGGFRLNFEADKTLTSYSNGQNGPNFDADLYSVEIYEDNSTTEQLTCNMEKKRVWGYSGNTQTDFIGDDVDYVVYTIGNNGNGISGNTNISLNFTDCSTSFDKKVYSGSSESLSLSYASPVSIIAPSSGECHVHYNVIVGQSGYTSSLSSANFKFTILGDDLWGGETYTHSNVTGQTQYGSGCDDAIYAATDGELRMPTEEQLQELLSGTTHTWKTIDTVNGTVNGMKFWSGGTEPMDSDKYIFIPAAGYCWFGTHRYQNTAAYIWSNTRCIDEDNAAWTLWCQEPIVNPENRCAGHNLRGVAPSGYTGSDVVDLGLSVKWAKCNLGATKPSDFGKFYQWGDTQGYTNTTLAHSFDWSHYKWGTENNITKYNNEDIFNLKTDDDAAYVTSSGHTMSIPTNEQLQELLDETSHELTSISGVTGMKFINKTDNTKYIFIPFGGYYDEYGFQRESEYGLVWSQSRFNDSEGNARLLECYKNLGDSTAKLNNVGRNCGLNIRPVAPSAYGGDDVVDLGLSVKWAKTNLGATKETDYGLYYQWGDTQGYEDDSEHKFKWNDYKWYDSTSETLTKYNNEDICILDHGDDAAYVTSSGHTMSIPTKEQIYELLNNTNHNKVTINGIYGMKFINKSDSTKYIFIPFGGYHNGDIHKSSNECGYIWSGSRDFDKMDNAYSLNFDEDGNIILDDFNRCLGFNVRPVAPSGYTGNDVVDLGLSVKWAKTNLGSETCTDFGLFYQWGDIQGYDGEIHRFNCDDYKWYDSEIEYTVEDDAVYMATDGKMCTPTADELKELLSGTTHEWTSIDGVNGMKLWNKNAVEPDDEDGNSYLFIPAAGYWWDGEKFEDNLSGYIWSNSYNDKDTADCLKVIPVTTVGSGSRVGGYNLRGVAPSGYSGDGVVDLGLSVKWAKCNLGAETETDSGLFYQWGDTQGYSGATVHDFNFGDYIWGSGQYSSDVTKYNSDDGKIILDTKICKHWVQTYSDSIPYSTSNRPDMSVCICNPSSSTEYMVSQVLHVDTKYKNESREHHNDDKFIVPYEHFNATDTPITNKNAKDEYYYQLKSDTEASLSGNTFITIPTKTIYSSMNASSLNLSTLLKQGVTYNVGCTYFAGGISCIKGSSSLDAKVRLDTPLRQNDGSINYNSDTLNSASSWHTIGNIANYWVENSQIGSVTYDPLKIEFTYRRKTMSPEHKHSFFFSVENGLTYKVTITFPENV